jgi:polyhydroxybutyrate depolymerase
VRARPFSAFAACAAVAVAAACGSSGSGSSSSGSSGMPPTPDAAVEDGSIIVAPDADVPDTAPPPPPPPVYVKSTHETTTFNGVPRKYNLSVPVDYDASKVYPLVLSFHGSPGTADAMLAYDPFDGASKKEAIIAYPNALGADWDLATATDQNPDLGFTKALIDELATKWNIDKAKVYGVGWSGGGFFVNQLACRMSGLLRAMSPHSGGAPYDEVNQPPAHYPNGFTKCAGEAPIPTIIFHGALDGAVPYASGQFESTYWGYVNGCSDNTSPALPAPCVSHDGCPAATPVIFCGLPNAGHGVSVDGFATTWAFFKALP